MAGGPNLAQGFHRWLERDHRDGKQTPIGDLLHMVEKELFDPVFPIRLGEALVEQGDLAGALRAFVKANERVSLLIERGIGSDSFYLRKELDERIAELQHRLNANPECRRGAYVFV